MEAALERRRIAKRQAAARAERKRKAAISIALNEKRKEKLKVHEIFCCCVGLFSLLRVFSAVAMWVKLKAHVD